MTRMSGELEAKFEELMQILSESPPDSLGAGSRGILIIYPPADELRFSRVFEDYRLQMKAKGIPHTVLSLDTMPFEYLERDGVLSESYALELRDAEELRKYLGSGLSQFLLERVLAASEELGRGGIILKYPTALLPWVSYADLLSRLPAQLPCCVVIPFPGSQSEGKLHFLDHKTGFNYLARRL